MSTMILFGGRGSGVRRADVLGGKCCTFVGRRPTNAVSTSNGVTYVDDLRTVQRVITVYHAARADKSRSNLGVVCRPKSSTGQGTHRVEKNLTGGIKWTWRLKPKCF